MTRIKLQHSKFLLFPKLSSGEAGEKNYINFNHALSDLPACGGTVPLHSAHDEKTKRLEKAGRLEIALRDLKTAIDDVNKTLNNWNNHK